jgi:hypothetical protein
MANRLTRDTVAEEPREARRLEGWIEHHACCHASRRALRALLSMRSVLVKRCFEEEGDAGAVHPERAGTPHNCQRSKRPNFPKYLGVRDQLTLAL